MNFRFGIFSYFLAWANRCVCFRTRRSGTKGGTFIVYRLPSSLVVRGALAVGFSRTNNKRDVRPTGITDIERIYLYASIVFYYFIIVICFFFSFFFIGHLVKMYCRSFKNIITYLNPVNASVDICRYRYTVLSVDISPVVRTARYHFILLFFMTGGPFEIFRFRP